jgi:hypothetical protein
LGVRGNLMRLGNSLARNQQGFQCHTQDAPLPTLHQVRPYRSCADIEY